MIIQIWHLINKLEIHLYGLLQKNVGYMDQNSQRSLWYILKEQVCINYIFSTGVFENQSFVHCTMTNKLYIIWLLVVTLYSLCKLTYHFSVQARCQSTQTWFCFSLKYHPPTPLILKKRNGRTGENLCLI